MDIGYRDPAPGGVGSFARDLLKGAGSVEEKLDVALSLLCAASRHFELSADPAFIADGSLRILDCNPAFLRLAGGALGPEVRLEALFSAADGPAFVAGLLDGLRKRGFWEGEAPRGASGVGSKPERLTLAALRGPAPAAFVGIFRDVSELRRAEARLAYTENHDVLTGLPNRQQYLASLEDLLPKAGPEGAEALASVAACVLDIDDFKRFNNDASREVGDDLLRAVAGRLAESVRQADLLARTGGDEFSLCFSLDSGAALSEIAGRVLSLFSSPFRVRGRLYHLRASMGIAIGPGDGAAAETLAAAADLALQSRKADGKSGFAVYRKGLEDLLVGASALEGELRQAISAGSIAVHYQPIARISDLAIEAVEALARWERPGCGFFPPSRFIPIAEEAGFIGELGDSVLRQSCVWRSALAGGTEAGPRVCVNFSARQLRDPGFAGAMADAVASYGVPPRLVTVEITESGLLGDLEAAARVVEEIRRTGARVLVDDFGAGFASLSYLKSLPVDGVKIDMSFISDIETNPQSRGIVEAIVFLARELGIETIAEGVETPSQLALVREIGCDYVQGFLVSRALPGGEIEGLLGSGARGS